MQQQLKFRTEKREECYKILSRYFSDFDTFQAWHILAAFYGETGSQSQSQPVCFKEIKNVLSLL